jgi:hypothetical protein
VGQGDNLSVIDLVSSELPQFSKRLDEIPRGLGGFAGVQSSKRIHRQPN